jgi:cell division protein FtsW
MLVFIGKYPLKYIGAIVGSGIYFLLFFVLVAKAFLILAFFSRVTTWERIEFQHG